MLPVFVIGFLLTVIDFMVGYLDFFPDCAGLLAISVVLLSLRNKGKLPVFFPALGLIGAGLAVVLYTSSSPRILIPFMLIENIILYIILIPFFRLLFPKRKKGSIDAIRYSTVRTSLLFIAVARSFAMLFGIFPVIGWIFRVLVWCSAVFIVIMVCRRWSAHLINNKYLED